MNKVFLALMLFGLSACSADYLRKDKGYEELSGFDFDAEAEIEDTTDHRAVVDVLVNYRNSLLTKDVGLLRRLISDEYYSNSGTTNTTSDDYGVADLPDVFELFSKHADEVKYDIVIKAVSVVDRKATVDYEYSYAYRYDVNGQAAWDAGVDLNRLELVRLEDTWKIVSGL